MKSLRFLAVAPFILIGCGDDNNNNGTDATTSTSNPDTNNNCEEPAPGTSALTGVNTAVTPQPTNPNPNNDGCTSPVIANSTGAKYPWGGATVSGRTYTCNACPFGYPFAQGAYRLHGFSKEDGSPCGSLQDTDCAENYSEPKPAEGDFAETLWLDGNTFRVRQKNGSAANDIEIKGYYFCGMKPEGPNEHVVWAILEATPGNVADLQPGDFLESDKLLGNAENMATFWFEQLNSDNTGANSTATYCLYGETDSYGNVCSDPFGDVPCD